MLTNRQRAFLRGKANGLSDILQIGKAGLTPEVTAAADEALAARELIKLSVLGSCEQSAAELADTIHERTHSDVVQVIGNKFVLFRKVKKGKSMLDPGESAIK